MREWAGDLTSGSLSTRGAVGARRGGSPNFARKDVFRSRPGYARKPLLGMWKRALSTGYLLRGEENESTGGSVYVL